VSAVDTSSLVASLAGARGPDVDAAARALAHRQAVLPPVGLAELSSDPRLARDDIRPLLASVPTLEILEGEGGPAGQLRSQPIVGGGRAPLADTLITQPCPDHDVKLATRDRDLCGVRSRGRPSAVRSAAQEVIGLTG
jgi:predicted nucleic acid-binding protein